MKGFQAHLNLIWTELDCTEVWSETVLKKFDRGGHLDLIGTELLAHLLLFKIISSSEKIRHRLRLIKCELKCTSSTNTWTILNNGPGSHIPMSFIFREMSDCIFAFCCFQVIMSHSSKKITKI